MGTVTRGEMLMAESNALRMAIRARYIWILLKKSRFIIFFRDPPFCPSEPLAAIYTASSVKTLKYRNQHIQPAQLFLRGP